MRKSLSEKELGFISKLELKQKYFFTRDDIKDNFTSTSEMNVYIHRLKKKGRVIRINKTKYFLMPVKAVNNKWTEHPYILIDEIMNGKDYCIAGKAAAYCHKLIEQVPVEFDVYNLRTHKKILLFHARINFKKKRKLPEYEERAIYGHGFRIATKKEARKWA